MLNTCARSVLACVVSGCATLPSDRSLRTVSGALWRRLPRSIHKRLLRCPAFQHFFAGLLHVAHVTFQSPIPGNPSRRKPKDFERQALKAVDEPTPQSVQLSTEGMVLLPAASGNKAGGPGAALDPTMQWPWKGSSSIARRYGFASSTMFGS